jgi:hypothetical protein
VELGSLGSLGLDKRARLTKTGVHPLPWVRITTRSAFLSCRIRSSLSPASEFPLLLRWLPFVLNIPTHDHIFRIVWYKSEAKCPDDVAALLRGWLANPISSGLAKRSASQAEGVPY